MALLLLSLVITIFIVPALLPYGSSGRYLIDAMMTVNMLLGVLAISDHRKIAAGLIVLSLLAIVARWADLIIAPSIPPAMRELPTIVVLLVLGVAVGINVFGPARAVVDRILGAVVLYLLLGLEWAVGYGIIDAYLPGAFTGSGRGIQHWVYFSFVTLTTVGYGDIVPIARAARSAAILEALVGQLYPAVILARVVSLRWSAAPGSDERP